MTPGERWLTVTWPVVRACLPAPPARVVEVGCGPLGGFVPMLRANRYDAVGIDPQAPDAAHYQRIEFERAELPRQVDAVVASTSLHHVADPAQVIDRITNTLRSGGALVVVEWGWEKFDQQTAEWCFERLAVATQLSLARGQASARPRARVRAPRRTPLRSRPPPASPVALLLSRREHDA